MPRPKIYISHPPLTIEETARRVGVSKRRLKELMVVIADLNGSKPSRRVKSTGKQGARKQPKQTAKR
jgi:DNA-binding transcriptional regulator GbsR (MarR family)